MLITSLAAESAACCCALACVDRSSRHASLATPAVDAYKVRLLPALQAARAKQLRRGVARLRFLVSRPLVAGRAPDVTGMLCFDHERPSVWRRFERSTFSPRSSPRSTPRGRSGSDAGTSVAMEPLALDEYDGANPAVLDGSSPPAISRNMFAVVCGTSEQAASAVFAELFGRCDNDGLAALACADKALRRSARADGASRRRRRERIDADAERARAAKGKAAASAGKKKRQSKASFSNGKKEPKPFVNPLLVGSP